MFLSRMKFLDSISLPLIALGLNLVFVVCKDTQFCITPPCADDDNMDRFSCTLHPQCSADGSCESGQCRSDHSGRHCCVECLSNLDCTSVTASQCLDYKCVSCKEPARGDEVRSCLHLVHTPVCSLGTCVPCDDSHECPQPANADFHYVCEKGLAAAEAGDFGSEKMCKPDSADLRCYPLSDDRRYDFVPCRGTPLSIVSKEPILKYLAKDPVSSMEFCRHDYEDKYMYSKCFRAECSIDEDCTKLHGDKMPVRARCNQHNFACVQCISDSDCDVVDGQATFCDFSDGLCKQCIVDEDCQDPKAPKCDHNTCKACEFSTDCRHLPGLPNCVVGVKSRADDGTKSECVAASDKCSSPLDVCSSGVCKQAPSDAVTPWHCVKCTRDEDCAMANPKKPVCLRSTGECSECDPQNPNVAGSCTGHKMTPALLNSGLQPCTAEGYCEKCEDDGMCEENYVCDERISRCAKCVKDEDCSSRKDPDGHICRNGKCVECNENSDCLVLGPERSKCDVRAGKCIVCMGTEDCKFDSQHSVCSPVGCLPCTGSDQCSENAMNDHECQVAHPGAAKGSDESIEGNECTACVKEYRISQSECSRIHAQYVENLIHEYNKGCDGTMVCGSAGVCVNCDMHHNRCNDPKLSRCNRQSCQPCLTSADCRHIRGQKPEGGRMVSTQASFCKIDDDAGANECVECVDTLDCYAHESTRGHACVNNQCTPCSLGSDACGDSHICEVNSWVASPAQDARSTQCKARIGRSCSRFSVECQANSTCVFDQQLGLSVCKAQLGMTCYSHEDCLGSNKCFEPIDQPKRCVQCTNTNDCASDEKGWGACAGDNTCKPCDESRNIQCHGDGISRQYHCDNGVCGVCNETMLDLCADKPGYSKCFEGRCSPCRHDTDCQEGNARYCRDVQPRVKQCVECTQDANPPCQKGMKCGLDFKCVSSGADPTLCSADADCNDAKAPICNILERRCVPCGTDDQCKEKMSHSLRNIVRTRVRTDLMPHLYGCLAGQCIECYDSRQCQYGEDEYEHVWEVCEDNTCKPCSGDASRECPDFAPMCDVGSGQCHQCAHTWECPRKLACSAGHCVPCGAMFPCGDGFVCHEKQCVQCTVDDNSQCQFYGDKEACANNFCVQCTKTADCASHGSLACIQNMCRECRHDGDCNVAAGDSYTCHEDATTHERTCVGTSLDLEKAKEKAREKERGGPQFSMKEHCPVGYYLCASGSNKDDVRTGCLNPERVCDGKLDCNDGEDETKIACFGYGSEAPPKKKEKNSAAEIRVALAAISFGTILNF